MCYCCVCAIKATKGLVNGHMQAWLAGEGRCCAGSAAYVLVLSAGIPSANSHLQTDPGHQPAPSPASRALPGHVGTSSGRALSGCKHTTAPASFQALQPCYYHSCCTLLHMLPGKGACGLPNAPSRGCIVVRVSSWMALSVCMRSSHVVSRKPSLNLESAPVHGSEDSAGVC